MSETVTTTRKVDRILYVCTDCHDGGEEICGYADRRDLVVMPDGRWLCENCLMRLPERESRGLKCPPAYGPAKDGTHDEGIDLALVQLAKILGVDPKAVTWDAATETVEGDVTAVISNILCAKYGDDFDPRSPRSPQENAND